MPAPVAGIHAAATGASLGMNVARTGMNGRGSPAMTIELDRPVQTFFKCRSAAVELARAIRAPSSSRNSPSRKATLRPHFTTQP